MSIGDAVGIVLLLTAAMSAVPALVLFVEIAAAVIGRGRPPGLAFEAPGRGALAVLMPAHDEAAGIEAAIAAVRPQLGVGDRLLVVADNCSDTTAALARAAGAEVTERRDTSRRGKGYALDHGVRWLERDPPETVVILDADCIAAPQALAQLAILCRATGRPVQALYLMHAPPGAPLRLRVAEFAWAVKNKLRPSGSAALGAPCQLMGTGMAFPWAMLRAAPLASGHLVEDMQLGLDLALSGTSPLFCPQAVVMSTFPSDAEAARSQRTRWEHGHLSVLIRVGPRALALALRRGDGTLAAMALDLMVPPIGALVLFQGSLLLAGTLWWMLTGWTLPFVLAAAAFSLVVVATLLAWWREGRRSVTAFELLKLPLYIAAKLPVYMRLFTRRQVEWVRTKRDGHGP